MKQFALRKTKALKIQRILTDFAGEKELSRKRCLDIGCANGAITARIEGMFKKTIGMDYSFDLVRDGRQQASPAEFLQADGVRLPFASASFDIVLCAQVYEHINGAEQLPAEVERVLAPGGLCFFSGPNKIWPIEPHYGLPALHWLPGKLATRYLRASGKGEVWDIRPFTVWRLRRLWRRFTVHDYTIAMLRQPERFGLSMPQLRHLRRAPRFLMRLIYDLLPNYNWVLVKPDAKDIH